MKIGFLKKNLKILSWSSQLGSHNFVQKRYFIQFINYMLSLMAEINQFHLFSATFFSVQGGNFLTFDGNNKQTWDDFCNLHLHFKCLKRFYRFSNPGGFSFKNKIYLFKFLSWQSRNVQNKWSASTEPWASTGGGGKSGIFLLDSLKSPPPPVSKALSLCTQEYQK